MVPLEEHDSVVAWVVAGGERRQDGAGRERELKGVPRRCERPAVVVRGADEQHESRHLAITLLQSDSAQLGLGVTQACDGLHHDPDVAVGEERVECAQVAGDVEGSLELPAPSAADPCAEAAEKVQLSRVAEAAPGRVEAGMQAEADGSTVSRKIGYCQISEVPVFHATDPRV
jgi:hypothetical protein